MSLFEAKTLRERRVALHEQAQAILKKVEDEAREMTAEESATFDRIHDEIETLRIQVERIERSNAVEKELAESRRLIAGAADAGRADGKSTSPEEVAKAEISRRAAFRKWMVAGPTEMTPEERRLVPRDSEGAVLFGRLQSAEALVRQLREQRAAQSSGTTTTGGFSVPDEPMRALEDALLQFGGIRQARTTILRTATGADLPIPTVNDTGNIGVLLAENTQETTNTQLTFGQVVLKAYKFSSDIILASLEFLQDTSIDADVFIARKLGERLGRVHNWYATLGTNSSQPQGILWAATAGKTAASATTIAATELVDLFHSVDPAYRENAEWMFSDGTLAVLKKLSVGTSDNRPLWMPGVAGNEPDTIYGKPYVINQNITTVAADQHSVLFGDFSKFYLRDVMDIRILRLVEKYADYAQVGYLGFSRMDTKLVDAGTHPIKFLRHPAS